jgi:hypothetical protein
MWSGFIIVCGIPVPLLISTVFPSYRLALKGRWPLLEGENLLVLYYLRASEICPDKRGELSNKKRIPVHPLRGGYDIVLTVLSVGLFNLNNFLPPKEGR